MRKIFNKNNYYDIVAKYSPYRNGGDPLGTNPETTVYYYEVCISGKEGLLSSYENGIGTAYNGEDYTPDSEELPEPLDIVHIPAGEYMKIVMPPEYKTQEDFFDAIWEHLKKWGYMFEGDAILTLTNINNEKDCIRLLAVRKKGNRSTKPKEDINQHSATQPQIVRDWIAKMDKFMRNARCSVQSKVVSNNVRTDSKFIYTSKKTKKMVCNINIGMSGCNISLRGYHFMFPGSNGNIMDEYPQIVIPLARTSHAYGGCRKPDLSIDPGCACVHGIAGIFTHNGETFGYCAYGGFHFELNDTTNFALLTRWIELESTFDGEIKPMQLKIGKIIEIKCDEIDILDEYLNGQPKERCINALWNVYNVMKKISADATYKTTFSILYRFCKSAVFKDENMDTLICTDAFKPNEWLSGTNYQYLPEKYGFVYSDIVYRDGVVPKKKTDLRQIERLTLSYNDSDFSDVMFGMMLFVKINEKQAWPYFYEADVRIAGKKPSPN